MKSIEKLQRELESENNYIPNHEDLEAMASIIRKIGGIVNNHTDEIEPVGGLVLLQKGEIGAWFGGCSSLNRAYYSERDGRVHVSTWAIAGTVFRGAFKPQQEDIDLYNEPLLNPVNEIFSGDRIIDFIAI